MKQFLTGVLISSIISTQAYAGDLWICTYPGFEHPHRTVVAKYKVEGLVVRDLNFAGGAIPLRGLKYTVLQNDDTVLTASASIPMQLEEDENPSTALVLSFIINKKTNDFGYSSASITSGAGLAKGKCIKD